MDERTKRLRTVRAAARELGLSDEGLRDIYARTIGSRSASAASAADLGRVLDALKAAGWRTKVRARKGDRRQLNTPMGAKVRVLWVAAWNLGIAYDPTETGLGTWIERQTGISAMNWLDVRQTSAVIEALKSWIAREGWVIWPPARAGALEAKRAVIEAQLSHLRAAMRPDLDLSRMGAAELDAVSADLGIEIRRMKAAS
ncbi:regulatory protein GemA [Tistrella bauzanensis]|uniref:regulatory protein GemA n=1 Tax=Tistrella TaxID=171436 RepID=UPI0031F614CA